MKDPLREDVAVDVGGVLAPSDCQRARVTPGELPFPADPGRAAVPVLEGEEERQVLEPGRLPPAEGRQRSLLGSRGALREALRGPAQERRLEAGDTRVLDGRRCEGRGAVPRRARQILLREPALVPEVLQRDQERPAKAESPW